MSWRDDPGPWSWSGSHMDDEIYEMEMEMSHPTSFPLVPAQPNYVWCPVGELICDLISTGSVLNWVVKHARDDDPLPRMWRDCRDPTRMCFVIHRVFGFDTGCKAAMSTPRMVFEINSPAHVVAICDAIRALVPTVTLAQVLESKR